MVPANKAILARIHGEPHWSVVRPPLVALSDEATRQLLEALAAHGYEVEQPLTVD
jgi:dihydrodipicolinate synthase/N-acetylneuraminate lyase